MQVIDDLVCVSILMNTENSDWMIKDMLEKYISNNIEEKYSVFLSINARITQISLSISTTSFITNF